MKKKLLYFKYKTIITVFALLLSVWSWGQNSNNPKVLAQTSDNSSHEFKMTEQNPVEMMKEKKEDISKRDAFSKHFKNEDGSYTALIGAGPIHYRKNGNAYEDIDTKIIKNNDQAFSYANITNLFESYYGAKASHGVKSKTFEGEIREFLDTKMYWEVDGQAVNIQNSVDVTVLIKGDKAYYNNLFGNISAEFIVKSGQRKLNYIIPDKQSLGKIPSNADYLVFTEKIKLPSNFKIVDEYTQYNKLKKEYRNIPGVFIIDSNENVIFEYSAPAIVEDYNSDVMGIPSQILPEISFKKEGDFVILYTKVKATWITENSRIFPIAIDPTVTAYPFTATFSSGQTYSSGGASGDIAVGYSGGWYRGWATFDLTSLPSLSGVTGATMSLYIGNKGGTMGGAASSINIGHTSFDLSRLIWLNNYTNLYNAITAANNGMGAYNFMPNQNIGTWAHVNLRPGTSTVILEEIEKKSGSDIAFFPVSFSPSWGSGTTSRFYVLGGFSSVNKPYLTITYTDVDKYKHAAYQYANAAAIGDVGYVQIGNVSIGSINNTTSITNYAAPAATIYRNTPTGYNKYNLSTNVNTGSSYTLNATYRDLGAPYNSGKIAVWIDWNEDGDFADANEYIGVSDNTTSGNQVRSFIINVPSEASAGIKRLRLRSFLYDDTITSSNYDTTFEYGETEDYDIVVNPALIVSEAYAGASYANGSYQITYNTPVTTTAGIRPGYVCTGWIGTGNVPATGITDTVTFTLTQHSTITWQWEQQGDCASETKWTSTGWTNGVPDGTGGKKKIIFETDYNSSINPSNSGILIGCSAEIRNTANVTLASYHNLTIDNEIVVASGASFVLKSDANLLQINNEPINQNEGVVKVERLIAESSPLRKEYNYLSSPVIGQNMKRLFGNDVSNTPYTMVLNESTNLFVNAKDVDYQIRAKGFAVKEPKPAYLGTLAEYSGEPINGEFGITVSRAANNRGWNLIGNPYPSGLDLYSLYHSNGNDDVIISEFRFWDNRLNNTYTQYGGNYNGYSYAIYNAATGANGTGNPAPGGDGGNNTGTPNPTTPVDGDFRFVKVGQGFLVRAKNLGTNELNFSNDFRTITKITDDGFFGKSSQIQDDRYRLQLITPDEIVLTNTMVYFEGGNHAFGIEDSKHPSPSSSDTFYSFAEEEKVVINGRNSFTNADIVRLGTSNYLSGTYKIRMMDATGIFPYSQRIYLNDKENHIITDLTEGEYVFYSESGSFTNRFEIIYKPESTLGVTIRNASNVTVYNDNENFVIRSMKPIKEIELYDISGKLMLVLKKSDKEIRIDASRIANGIYILKIVQEDGTESIKKVRK